MKTRLDNEEIMSYVLVAIGLLAMLFFGYCVCKY